MNKKRRKKAGLAVFLTFVLLAVSAYAYGSTIMSRLKSDNVKAKKIDTSKPVNILILGVDAGDYDNKSKNSPKRSDTMMLVRYVPETENVFMLSIPRDTRITYNGHPHKLNSVHGIGGPSLTIDTIEKMLNVDVNYYVSIDYEGFRKCIDAIGGVDVVVPQDMDYDAYDIKIHFKKGETVHLDGKRAEEFVRWRKNNDGTGYAMGDLGRISSQQEFMMNVLQKIKSPSIIVRLPKLIDTISRYVKTNMDSGTMAAYGLRLKNISVSQIQREVLKGEPQYIGKVSYFIRDKAGNEEFLSNFRSTNSMKSLAEIDKSNVKVKILNSTGVKGLAKEYKDRLEGEGYKVVQIDNYSKKLQTTLINDYSSKGYGGAVSEDLQIGDVIEKSGDNPNANVVVILGKDSIK